MRWLNFNMRCIETIKEIPNTRTSSGLNFNMRCIETADCAVRIYPWLC